MKLLAFVVVIIAASSAGVDAQGSVLSGRVVDAVDGLPIPGAYVTVVKGSDGIATKTDGTFRFADAVERGAELQFSHLGYETKRVEVLEDGILVVQLQPKVLEGEETVVIGKQLLGQARALSTQMRNANITNVVAADQVGRFPDANIGDALKRIPGLSVEYDQGEARFGLVRGTEARLNSVTVSYTHLTLPTSPHV